MLELLQQTDLDDLQRERTGVAQASGQLLMQLADGVLDLSKGQAVDLERLFRLFEGGAAGRRHGGTGLGLALCRLVVGAGGQAGEAFRRGVLPAMSDLGSTHVERTRSRTRAAE